MISHQRQEAHRIRQCLEQEKHRLMRLQKGDDKYRIKQTQKDAVYKYFNQVSMQVGHHASLYIIVK